MRGIALTENLPLSEQLPFIRHAADVGYNSAWTNETRSRDGFMTCQARAAAAPALVTGIGVIPVLHRLPVAAAAQTATLAELTGGKFILGVGVASLAGYRQSYGIQATSAMRLMRDYIAALRGYLAGERVEVQSEAFAVHGDRLDVRPRPQPAPIYLAALGPKMQRLAGEISDGVFLNWNTPESVRQSRELVAAGAHAAGREPSSVSIAGYVRVSVDDDHEAARAAMASAAFGYAMIPSYRQHFENMGFKATTDRLAEQPAEERFTGGDEAALQAVSVYGTADEVRQRLPAMLAAYDHPIIRIVPARPTAESIRAVITACAP